MLLYHTARGFSMKYFVSFCKVNPLLFSLFLELQEMLELLSHRSKLLFQYSPKEIYSSIYLFVFYCSFAHTRTWLCSSSQDLLNLFLNKTKPFRNVKKAFEFYNYLLFPKLKHLLYSNFSEIRTFYCSEMLSNA